MNRGQAAAGLWEMGARVLAYELGRAASAAEVVEVYADAALLMVATRKADEAGAYARVAFSAAAWLLDNGGRANG